MSVANVHTKGWRSRAGHVTKGALVVVHVVTHVVPQQSLRWVILGAMWALVLLHCNNSCHQALDNVSQFLVQMITYHASLNLIDKYISALQCWNSILNSTFYDIFVCVFCQQVGNLLSKGTWRLQWSKNFVLVANSPPHVGHPTSFSCVWLLTWSANLYTERKTDLQPAEWKSWYFSMGIILSASLFTIIWISWCMLIVRKSI